VIIADPAFYVFAVPALLVIGVSKAGFGGGLAVVAVPLMSLAVDPRVAAAVTLPVLCAMDLYGLWAWRGQWLAAELRVLLPAGLAGITLGTLTFSHLDASALRLIVGVLALAVGVRPFLGFSLPAPRLPMAVAGGFWGGVSGFASFVAHAGGPPLTTYLLGRRLAKPAFVATSVAFFSAANFVKLIPYGWLGQFTTANLATSLLLAPLAPAGILLGVWLNRRLSDVLFFRLVHVLLLATGAKLCWDGATA